MKTALSDNSLCIYPIRDNATPEYIYRYISALRDAGVRYIELDFRSIMKLGSLPEGVKYIFRPLDPVFMRFTEVFKFDYILLTLEDLNKKFSTDIPVMLMIPTEAAIRRSTFEFVSRQLEGEVSAFKIRKSFDFMSRSEVARYVGFLRNITPAPIDICPMNGRKNSLDMAVKFAQAGIESLTLSMGVSERYCQLEEFLFALLTIYDSLPSEIRLSSLCKAAVFQKYIFRWKNEGLIDVMNRLDYDIHFLRNADTGRRVPLRVSLKENAYLKKTFVSALEKMADEEEIPEDIFEEISDAIKHFDVSLFDERLLKGRRGAFLN